MASESVICPRCEVPCAPEKLAHGICPRCIEICRSAHGRVLMDEDDAAKLATQSVGTKCEVTQYGIHFDDNSQRVPSTHDDEGDRVLQFCQRHGLSEMAARELIEDVMETFGVNQSHAGQEKAKGFMQLLRTGFAWMLTYNGDKKVAEHALGYNLEFYDLCGGTAVEAAKRCSTAKHVVNRQAMNKAIQHCRNALNGLPQVGELPPLPGMRSEEARKNMSEATTRGWRKKKAAS